MWLGVRLTTPLVIVEASRLLEPTLRAFVCVRVLGVDRCAGGTVFSLLTQSLVVGPDFVLAFFGCGVAPLFDTELLSSLSISGSSSLFSPTITLMGGPSSNRDDFDGLLIFHWAPRATKGILFCTSMFKFRSLENIIMRMRNRRPRPRP